MGTKKSKPRKRSSSKHSRRSTEIRKSDSLIIKTPFKALPSFLVTATILGYYGYSTDVNELL